MIGRYCLRGSHGLQIGIVGHGPVLVTVPERFMGLPGLAVAAASCFTRLPGFTVAAARCFTRFPGFPVRVSNRFTGRNGVVAGVTGEIAVFAVGAIRLNLRRRVIAIAVRHIARFLGFAISVAADLAPSSALTV